VPPSHQIITMPLVIENRKVLSLDLNDDVRVDITFGGILFHVAAAVTGNARSPVAVAEQSAA